MEEKFLAYFSQFRPLTDEERSFLTQSLVVRPFEKGSFLLMAGQNAVNNFFVLVGCVRKYYVRDGEERITDFYTEEDWILPAVGVPVTYKADFFLECVEDTTLVVASEQEGNELLAARPEFQLVAQQVLEQELMKQHAKQAAYQTATPEQRYLGLLRDRPDLIERVPQFLLSSYIGVRPESLSRIRKRLGDQVGTNNAS